MKISRDLTIYFIRSLGRNLVVCDALAGIGARGIRIAKECEVKLVWLNDVSKEAIDYARKNVKLNGISNVKLTCMDARLLLTLKRAFFDYIDLDPFGSPSRFLAFLPMAMKKVSFLGITATDLACLMGKYPLTCLRKYGALSFKIEFSRELGLRILVANIALTLSKHGIGITPLVSYHHSNHYRVFLKALKKKSAVNETLKNLGWISYCKNCLWREPGIKSSCCSKPTLILGPLWLKAMNQAKFVETMLSMAEGEAFDLLNLIRHELDIPYHYELSTLAKAIKRTPSLDEVRTKLEKRGFRFSRTHYTGTSFKTDASFAELKAILT